MVLLFDKLPGVIAYKFLIAFTDILPLILLSEDLAQKLGLTELFYITRKVLCTELKHDSIVADVGKIYHRELLTSALPYLVASRLGCGMWHNSHMTSPRFS